MAAYMAYGEALRKAGAFLGSNRLKPSANSTTVRVANGKTQVLDGPVCRQQGTGRRLLLIDVPIWTPRSPGPRAARPRVTASSKCVRSCRCPGERTLVTFRGGDEARRTADAVARRSYGKLVAFLASRTGMSRQPRTRSRRHSLRRLSIGRQTAARGIRRLAAHRRAPQADRRRPPASDRRGCGTQLQILAEGLEDAAAQAERDMQIPDKRLALLFACAHPAIEAGIRAPLMLQVVLGLDGETIASAFLVSPAAMRKRLWRAKEKIQQAGIPFAIPERDELPHASTPCWKRSMRASRKVGPTPSGTDAIRRDLTDEAIFLARLVVELLPQEAEGLGLLALMLHAEARRPARRNAAGEYVPLAEQDPAAVELADDRRGRELCCAASKLETIGRYQLEAALQSAHAHRRRTGHDNWAEVVQLYDALFAITDSRRGDQSRARDCRAAWREAAVAAIKDIATDERLNEYQPYWAARAELLEDRCAWRSAPGV